MRPFLTNRLKTSHYWLVAGGEAPTLVCCFNRKIRRYVLDILYRTIIVLYLTPVLNLEAQQSSYTYDQSGNVTAMVTTGNISPGVETQPQTQVFRTNSSV